MKKLLILNIFLINLFAITNVNIISSKNISILNSFNIDVEFLEDKSLNLLYKSYVKQKKHYFLNILENGYTYIPLIKNHIKDANIPADIIFVAMAESYFTTSAASNKSAKGMWQFIPATARKFGLEINDYVDERKDPIKSTIAAIKYLSYLKRKLGKWYLAMMAYNCGEARIIEAMTRARLDTYCENRACRKDKDIRKLRRVISKYQTNQASFASLYRVYRKAKELSPTEPNIFKLMRVQKKIDRQYLPRETRNYIRKIVAMSFLLNSDEFVEYTNHYLLNRGSVSSIVKVNVPSGTDINYVAKLLNFSPTLLKAFNRHLNYNFTPPFEDYFMYIPYQKLAYFKENFTKSSSKKEHILYVVKNGDTLGGIANKFNISYKVIKDFNNLKSNVIRPKDKLVVPIYKSNNITFSKMTYTVQQGDTLNSIANKFNVSYYSIKRENNLNNDIIKPNDKLIIPKKKITHIKVN
jgi:membrane-bound lytic murein transglycosylase D